VRIETGLPYQANWLHQRPVNRTETLTDGGSCSVNRGR
jgi:hypothetical protein